MSSVPTSLYGIHPNDDHDLHQDLMAPIDASSNMGSGEPFYPTPFDGALVPSFPNFNNISATQYPHEELPAFLMNGVTDSGVTDSAGLAPVFPTFNAFPHFRTPFPFALTLSQIYSGLPTTLESTLASPGPSRGNKPKRNRNRKSKGKRSAVDPAKRKRVAHTRRTRRDLTRNTSAEPHGARFEDMFKKLPLEVQRALNTFYTGCCESMTDRDNSTRQKHMFSKRHCDNLPNEYLDILPCFVCPAYIAFHGACKRAEPGRYDSAERHCRSCAGVQEMSSKCREISPVEITKGEHGAVKIHHGDAAAEPGHEEETRRLVANSVNKLLRMTGHGNVQIREAEPNLSEAIRAIFKSLGMM